jgi:diaminohydroxyphosphoribosylaminopyrimidine deaminase/5-amino-6-(5-phosphoribosylamino)uracil reductase
MLDRVQILIAPKLVGGREAPGPTGGDGISKMQQAIELHQPQWRESGDDRVLEAAITAEGLGEVSL